MIDVDNQDYSHEDCREPDLQDIIDNDAGYDEYKEKRAGVYPSTITKKEYDAFMANPKNFTVDEESKDDMTPEQMNNWLRQGGW